MEGCAETITYTQNPEAQSADPFDWLKELFRIAPEYHWQELPGAGATGYRPLLPNAPLGPGGAAGLWGEEPLPDPLKQLHGVEHVTRTQVLAEALLELFAHHDSMFKTLLEQQPELRELIPLAMVYHDATAEVEAKAVEEDRAAELFTRDMSRVGRYSAKVIDRSPLPYDIKRVILSHALKPS